MEMFKVWQMILTQRVLKVHATNHRLFNHFLKVRLLPCQNSQDWHLGAQSFHLQLQQVEFIAHLCIQQGPEHNEWLEKTRKSLENRRVDLKFFKHSSYILQLSHFIFQVVQVAPLIYFTLFTYCTAACYAVITAQGWNFASASDRPRNAPESSSSSSTVYGIQTCFFKRSYSSLKNWKTLKQKVRMSHTRRDVLALQILQKPGLYNSVQNTETTSFVSIFLSFNFKSSFLP